MKLDLLQKYLNAFAEFLGTTDAVSHLYKYDMLEHFRSTWTFDTEDFATMYDDALQSDVTRRWWKRAAYRPKEVMLLLIKEKEDYARQAFKELFNEQWQVENRVDRFVYYCDELLRMYKRAYPKSIENNHYQDSSMISLYLAAMYPDRYTLYPGRNVFNLALQHLNARTNPDTDDLIRFFKLSRTIYRYLMDHPTITAAIEKGLRPKEHLLLAHEFIFFAAGLWDQNIPE